MRWLTCDLEKIIFSQPDLTSDPSCIAVGVQVFFLWSGHVVWSGPIKFFAEIILKMQFTNCIYTCRRNYMIEEKRAAPASLHRPLVFINVGKKSTSVSLLVFFLCLSPYCFASSCFRFFDEVDFHAVACSCITKYSPSFIFQINTSNLSQQHTQPLIPSFSSS